MANVKIYTTPSCPWCKKTKEFLKENNISFKEFDVSSDEKARDEMLELSGQTGVPVVVIGDEVLVGYDPDAIMEALEK